MDALYAKKKLPQSLPTTLKMVPPLLTLAKLEFDVKCKVFKALRNKEPKCLKFVIFFYGNWFLGSK